MTKISSLVDWNMSNSVDCVRVSSADQNCRRNTQLKSEKSDSSSTGNLLYRVIPKVYSVQNLLTGASNLLTYRYNTTCNIWQMRITCAYPLHVTWWFVVLSTILSTHTVTVMWGSLRCAVVHWSLVKSISKWIGWVRLAASHSALKM